MSALAVVRRPSRRTHLANAAIDDKFRTLCNLTLPADDARGVIIDITGGLTNRFMNELDREFSDASCCLRCSRHAVTAAMFYGARP